MNNRLLRHLQIILASIDVVGIFAVFYICQVVFNKYLSLNDDINYKYFPFYLCTTWLLISLVSSLYHEKYISALEHFLKRTTQVYIYFTVVFLFYLFFFFKIDIPNNFLLFLLFCISIVLLLNRFIYLGVFQYLKKSRYSLNKLLIIGYNPLSKKLVNYLEEDAFNKEIVGFCEDYEKVRELTNYPVLSNISGVIDVCKEHGVNEIYSTIAPEQNPDIYDIINLADQNCIRFKIIPDTGLIINRKVHLDYLKQIPVISLRREPLEEFSNRIKKRLFDFVFSLLVTVLILSWLVPIVALLIFIESRGPIFFIQPRSGKNNKIFLCFKFRSMIVNQLAHSQQATKDDSRITAIGRFLRKTNLDEFPQFLNVLTGKMSIVGPRPHMLKHTDEYSKLIGHFMVRQFIKPGITGWAQVNGYRGETKNVEQMQKRVEYDLWYMENWSMWLDLKIIFLTVYNTLRGEKNAF